ncbi:hypothetical protein Salat_2982300 [Sesamum alatum]|uniref:Uncharacterized protein n=1 Tax=Sesamum alatum TaxID=300844 RepID=A0AAE1XHI4_9LAMI|nr:hypothetical protein Salat_2978900 [Sesamum alatum]KAK4412307.1 hypothetical protein Salat_2982300 [Sesamum alatum]
MIMHCDNESAKNIAANKERFNVLIQLLDEHRIIPISIPLAKRSRARALSSSDDGALPVEHLNSLEPIEIFLLWFTHISALYARKNGHFLIDRPCLELVNKVDPSFPFHQGMESATTESIEGRRTLLKEKAQRPILLPIRRGLACIVEGEAIQ